VYGNDDITNERGPGINTGGTGRRPKEARAEGGEPMAKKPKEKKKPRKQPWFSLVLKLIVIIRRKP
jgi:hypothetical protein